MRRKVGLSSALSTIEDEVLEPPDFNEEMGRTLFLLLLMLCSASPFDRFGLYPFWRRDSLLRDAGIGVDLHIPAVGSEVGVFATILLLFGVTIRFLSETTGGLLHLFFSAME